MLGLFPPTIIRHVEGIQDIISPEPEFVVAISGMAEKEVTIESFEFVDEYRDE